MQWLSLSLVFSATPTKFVLRVIMTSCHIWTFCRYPIMSLCWSQSYQKIHYVITTPSHVFLTTPSHVFLHFLWSFQLIYNFFIPFLKFMVRAIHKYIIRLLIISQNQFPFSNGYSQIQVAISYKDYTDGTITIN